jgi:nicotinamidase-related amidase
MTVMIQRSVVHCQVGETKTEGSARPLPINPGLTSQVQEFTSAAPPGRRGTGSSRMMRPAALTGDDDPAATEEARGITRGPWKDWQAHVPSHLLNHAAQRRHRHGAQELLRHANIQTTMNIYAGGLGSEACREQQGRGDGAFGCENTAGTPDFSLKHPPLVGKITHAPDGRESRILIRDTWNTDVLDELKPQADDLAIYKHRFSGFYQTDLDATLRKLGIQYLIIAGCTTSVCVESTVRDAMFRDYSCVLLEDCMSQPTLPHSLPGSNHDASLVLAEAFFAWVSKSEQFMSAVQSQAVAPSL